ncbi:hypothetical protein F511_27481 [Dorcoceras hygrometricum]|uniref:Uncharacterized protein n=1 Tax=Dorcoceras hygrometricum TaxID=472368 RepID=A0A2Z7BXD9_9LAMI|nr:hypothetical protein F511_27481 [Dorcoceras hygrometricum]
MSVLTYTDHTTTTNYTLTAAQALSRSHLHGSGQITHSDQLRAFSSQHQAQILTFGKLRAATPLACTKTGQIALASLSIVHTTQLGGARDQHAYTQNISRS